MDNQPGNGEVTLADLLALVEKAVGAVERLQAANAALTTQLRQQQEAAIAAESDRTKTMRQIEELEQAADALRRDAHWCRWFRNKYGGAHFSTFYFVIEREYAAENPEIHAERMAHPQKGSANAALPDADNLGPD